MNTIGFKNFRRFKSFNPLEYGGITFLVGRNNAGKSTLVKALLLLDNYYKSGNFKTFSFGNNVLEDANIVTYGRAKNHFAEENFISFSQKIENFQIELTVSGDEDKAFANVHSLTINDIEKKLNFIFNIEYGFITIIKNRDSYDNKINQKVIEELETQILEIKSQLSEPGIKKTSKDYIELVSSLEKLENKLASVQANTELLFPNDDILFNLDEDFTDDKSLMANVEGFLQQAMSDYESEFVKIQNGEEASDEFEDLRALKEFDPKNVASSFSDFISIISDYSMAYMGANPAKQSALFAIRDKNNALSQAIHEYKQLNILKGEDENMFIRKWMKEFEVGEDFTISLYAGEAYEMIIHSNNTEIHLADKGMGSIQAMLLIMRIACVIRKIKHANSHATLRVVIDDEVIDDETLIFRIVDRTTVIIEEPELNLHPALQSKLADLFLDVHQRFKIDFIVETHSEYILRRSQVLVAENDFEFAPNENPFCVHYFPKDISQMPYRLEYQEDGSFNRNFGDGFFDEASSSTLDLLKLKRQKKS